MPDLHVEPGLFCQAQDLLIIYDDCPGLVRRDQLADLVREWLTEPDWPCPADPARTTT